MAHPIENMKTDQDRKTSPVYSGVLRYFPDAVVAVAQCSFIANEQHNPGTEMHWDRDKSPNELDSLTRHMLQAGEMDSDGIRHSTKVAWRALANLQKEIESDAVQKASQSDDEILTLEDLEDLEKAYREAIKREKTKPHAVGLGDIEDHVETLVSNELAKRTTIHPLRNK